MRRKRVQSDQGVVATPSDLATIELLGGYSFDGVVFTKQQFRKLKEYYGFSDEYIDRQVEESRAEHEERERKRAEDHKQSYTSRRYQKSEFDEEEMRDWYKAGSDRNLVRNMKVDGMRVMAYLLGYQIIGSMEDPVEFLEELLCEAGGFDVQQHEW